MHKTTLNGEHQTNNICEGWNNTFKHLVGHSHLMASKLIYKMRQRDNCRYSKNIIKWNWLQIKIKIMCKDRFTLVELKRWWGVKASRVYFTTVVNYTTIPISIFSTLPILLLSVYIMLETVECLLYRILYQCKPGLMELWKPSPSTVVCQTIL